MKVKYKLRIGLLSGLCASLLLLVACEPAMPALETEGPAQSTVALTVFSAASTTNVVQDLAAIYREKSGVTLVTSFASSSTLAKQIEQGAPADIYISANPKWMDYLEKAGKVIQGTREDLLGNRIVLIAPKNSALTSVDIKPGFDLPGLLGGDGRLGMGDPAHVPAGIYGKRALESLGVWSAVEGKVTPMNDVRAALAIVERGETPLGVVYATDVAMSDKVKVVGVFPESSHPPIVYPVAIVSASKIEASRLFLEFLKTPAAGAVFEKYGFALKQ